MLHLVLFNSISIHFTCLEVISSYTIEEFPIVCNSIHRMVESFTWFLDIVSDPTPVSKHNSPFEMLITVEHDHTTYTTSCDNMTRVKACSAYIRTFGVCNSIRRVFK